MTSIYIESGDEITTVIERLRASGDSEVALVAPKGATLLQSVVNLKLARKAAADAGKKIVVVSTDTIGRNLCEQLGIPVANTEEEAARAGGKTATTPGDSDAKVIAGVRIHNYYDEEHGDEDAADEKVEPIIIPKQMLKEEAEAPEPSIEVPAGTPEPPAPAEVVPAAPAPALTRSKVTEAPEPAVEVIEPHSKEVPAKTPTTPGQKRVIKLSLFFAGIAALIFITIAFLFLPFTRVDVAVTATEWSHELSFSASVDQASTSEDNTSLPAEALAVATEKTVVFTATGSKQVGDKATGTVTFYNYSTTNSVTVPSGTTITSSGKTFTTTEQSVVPGYTQPPGKPPVPGSNTAPITATEAGSESNLTNAPASNVTINGAVLSFNSVTTSGGTSKTVSIVSNDDITKAKAQLTTELTADAIQKLTDSLSGREVVYKADADVAEAGAVNLTVTAGQEAASGEARGSLTLRRTVIDRARLDDALSDRLRAEQLSNKSFEITKKDATITSISSDGKLLSLTVAAAGKESPIIPTSDIVKKLAGKSFSVGEGIVADMIPNSRVTTKQSPGWWPVRRFPTLNRYILLEVSYE